jgi:nucleotide-binding universal stress UspA family protein
MLAKCANPSCSAVFRYLYEGTIFQVTLRPSTPEEASIPRILTHERFWLCGECSRKMTVISHAGGILVVPLQDLSEKQKQQRNRSIAIGSTNPSSKLPVRSAAAKEVSMSAVLPMPVQSSIALKHILVATDFSKASERALDFATAIARRHGSVLSVVHAIPEEPHGQVYVGPLPHELDRRRLEAEQQLKGLEESPQIKNLPHRLLVEHGGVWDVLASEIQREDIDLLVLGTRGRSGLKKLALGSAAEEFLRLASCPVLTVGPKVPPPATADGFARILFATDFGPASDAAFPYALFLAKEYHAKLLLLHMVPPMPPTDVGPAVYGTSAYAADEYLKWQRSTRDEGMKKMKDLIPCDAGLAEDPEYLSGTDFLPEGILEAASAHRIDLIVMGANRTSIPRIAAHIPWALVHQVISHAKCPVLTVSN